MNAEWNMDIKLLVVYCTNVFRVEDTKVSNYGWHNCTKTDSTFCLWTLHQLFEGVL